jgi:hypothetical protein
MSFTSPWARLGQMGLLCSCCFVLTVTAGGGGGGSLLRGLLFCCVSLSAGSLPSRWSRFVGHGEAVLVIARQWWRVLVVGEVGGARWSVRGRGSVGGGRNPCQMTNIDPVTLTSATMPS